MLLLKVPVSSSDESESFSACIWEVLICGRRAQARQNGRHIGRVVKAGTNSEQGEGGTIIPAVKKATAIASKGKLGRRNR